MSDEIRKDDTEILIKKMAKKLFFGEGKFNATTQEIADAAGVNRTLINYYFRSRDNLFNLVFEEAHLEEMKKSNAIVSSNLTFREKLEHFIDYSLKSSVNYPYLEIYLVTQMNQGYVIEKPYDFDEINKQMEIEINKEIEKGNLMPISVTQFIINLASLVSFPTCMRPLLQKNLKLSNEEYDKILKERKDIILKTIFKN